MDEPTTVLLDVDGVLQSTRASFAADMDHAYEWRESYAAFQADMFRDPDYLATLTADLDVLAPIQRVLDRHVSGVEARQIHDAWSSSCEQNTELLALVPRIHASGVFLATNQDPRQAAIVEASYRAYDWCTGAFISCRVGHRKPAPEFFHAILADLGTPPGACFFVDDKQEFVDGAASVGIPGVRFRDIESFAADLTARGLLTAT